MLNSVKDADMFVNCFLSKLQSIQNKTKYRNNHRDIINIFVVLKIMKTLK